MCMLVWNPGDIPFQPNMLAVCTTQDTQSLFNCVCLAYFKGCHRNNSKRPVETTSFPSQWGEKKGQLWAWSIVRFEPTQIISFMLKFKEMRNILHEKQKLLFHICLYPHCNIRKPASFPPPCCWRVSPLCYPRPPTHSAVFVVVFSIC